MTLRNEPHDGSEPGPGPSVYVRFKSSSQPKGQDGYEVAVSSEATYDDVDRTMRLAARARQQAQDVLDGNYEERVETAAEHAPISARIALENGVAVTQVCGFCHLDGLMHTEAEWLSCQAELVNA